MNKFLNVIETVITIVLVGLITCLVIMVFSGCEDPGDELLGCTELSDGEVCVYCNDMSMIEFSREVDAIPYFMCEDFCNATRMGSELPGCKKYSGSTNTGI